MALPQEDFPAVVARLYGRWTLDFLPDLAYAISKDSVSRPQLYQDDSIPEDLIDIWLSYGNSSEFPNSAQRLSMMMPVFGRSDGSRSSADFNSPFKVARKQFIDVCTLFVEQASDAGKTVLQQRVRSSAATLHAYFHGFRGKSFHNSGKHVDTLFNFAIKILQVPAITEVFGIPNIEHGQPFSATDLNGAKFIENVGQALSLPVKFSATDFLLLRRIAEDGAETIQNILQSDLRSEAGVKLVLENGYAWAGSLREWFSSAPTAQSQGASQSSTTPTQPTTAAQRTILFPSPAASR